MIAGVVILHIWALHIPGSSNPTGVDVKSEQDTVPFHPYYTAKDGFGLGVVPDRSSRAACSSCPNCLGHPDNYIPANPLSTPAHIVPEWYFWPFYAILRAFTVDFILPAKLWGVLAMFGSILLLFFLPWLDKSPVRSGNYRPLFRKFFWFADRSTCWCSAIAAARRPKSPIVMLSQIATIYYFAHFLIILPIVSLVERPAAAADLDHRSGARTDDEAEAGADGSRAGRPDARRNKGQTHMVRFFGILVGLGFVGVAAVVASSGGVYAADRPSAGRHDGRARVPQASASDVHFASDGPFGKFDRQQLQRGFQVYKEVCAACHSCSLVAFRDLARARLQRGRGEGDRRPVADRGAVDQPGHRRSRRPARRLPPTTSRRPCQRRRGARGEQQRAAARPVADDQGAPRRRRLHLLAADRLSGRSRPSC